MPDVVVAGAGIIGLTTAIRLQAAGASVQVWSPDDPLDTVSAIAAAVWYPTRTDFTPQVRDWALASYHEYIRQEAAGVPGLLLRPTRNLGAATEELPWWAPPGTTVTDGEVRFVAPLAEMPLYLPWLRAQVDLVTRRLDTLDGVAPLLVNATGLAAGELAGDPAVHPARGQVVLVTNPGLDTSIRTQGYYIHPRRDDCVLGGTYQTDDWDRRPDPATSDDILAHCRELEPLLADAAVLGEKVGLRPARHGGPRVERVTNVIHNYGHGGAGMTLAWGCADEVVRLWQQGVR